MAEQTILVNGAPVSFDFPPDATDEEIDEIVNAELGQVNPPPEVEEERLPISEALTNVYKGSVADAQERWDTISENREYGPVGYALGMPISDYGGVVASEGVQMVGGMGMEILSRTPDAIKQPIKDTMAFFANSPYGQAALGALNKGLDYYNAWAQENPFGAEKVEQFVDVGAITSPRVNPIPKDVRRWSAEKALDAKQEKVKSLLTPPPNTGPGKWNETDTPSREAVYVETPREREMYNRVEMDVPKFNPNRTSRKNAQYVREVVEEARIELDARIVEQGNPKIDLPAMEEELLARIDELPSTEDGLALVGNPKAAEITEALYREAQRLISESDGTALGLMNVRREFDKIVERVAGSDVLDSDRINATGIGARLVRNLLNDTVIDAVPDANVHDLLDKQHQLLNAHEILNINAIKEAEDVVSRAMQRLKSTDLLPSTLMALGATGTYAYGALQGSELLQALSLGAGGLYLGGKFIGTVASKKVLGQTLSNLNKVIKTAQGSDLAKLKADRAILLEYLRSLPQDESEVGEVNPKDSRAVMGGGFFGG